MAQVRLITGHFLKLDGEVIETLESSPAGPITSILARVGTNGCSLGVGNFLPRL